MDKITICDLEVHYRVGVPEAERQKPQRLLITIVLELDLAKAGQTDDLRQTIDYFAVTQQLLQFGEGRSWRLIEALASDIAKVILEKHKPKSVLVRVKKFIIPQTQFVAVEVQRHRRR